MRCLARQCLHRCTRKTSRPQLFIRYYSSESSSQPPSVSSTALSSTFRTLHIAVPPPPPPADPHDEQAQSESGSHSHSLPLPPQTVPTVPSNGALTNPPFHTHAFFVALERTFPTPVAAQLMWATRALLADRIGRVKQEALTTEDLENVSYISRSIFTSDFCQASIPLSRCFV